MPGIYLKPLLMIILPVLLLFISALYWKIKKENREKKQIKSIASKMIIIDIIYPSILNSLIEVAVCDQVEGTYYLNIDYYYECFTFEHFSKVLIKQFFSLITQ